MCEGPRFEYHLLLHR